ncbi:MAG: s-methyl-5-thioribose-1-phosphate isomerase [Syntrophales bacterium]|nr:s-methyl-5-thioribose-1-phosphate isomerase [Syntrophales bacterium]
MSHSKVLLMDLSNTVYLEGKDALIIVDRRRLPREFIEIYCTHHEEVARAIEDMVVQGAGDIAITAAYGLYLTARELENRGFWRDLEELEAAAARLRSTRPTGHHLRTLLDRIMVQVRREVDRPASEVIIEFIWRALKRQREMSQQTGAQGERLLEDGAIVLTHCFAGAGLLYMFQYALEKGKKLKAVCTETRPYLQGARLTAWSLSEMGVDTTLITDNMAAWFMAQGKISTVVTAADRIAMDGSVANKVGTLQLAICARHYGIPFYVLGYGGPDPLTPTGKDIPIEKRNPTEVTTFRGEPITGERVKAEYPAFDVTPPDLITGIVTTRGIFRPERIVDYFPRLTS